MLAASTLIIFIFVFTSIIGQLIYPYGINSDKFFEKAGLYYQGIGMIGGILSAIFLMYYPYLMLSKYVSVILTILMSICFEFAMINAN